MERILLRRVAILVLLASMGLAGCVSDGVRVRPVRGSPMWRALALGSLQGRGLSPRTELLLRRYDLDRKFRTDPRAVLRRLDEQVRQWPRPNEVFALAELCHLTAQKLEDQSPTEAIALHLASVSYAYYYLFDETVGTPSNTYDPRFREACDLYNQSLARCIDLWRQQNVPLEGKFHLAFMEGGINITVCGDELPWAPDEFGDYRFAADYEVRGLDNHHRTYGLGVPLIAIRTGERAATGQDRYYFGEQSFPATAFLRMDGGILTPLGASRSARLEFHDPVRTQMIPVEGVMVPLESDLTTPLGYFLSRARLEQLELRGFLRGEQVQDKTGIYMVHPYERGKIPVVMIHGLWSSPMAWMRMLNDLVGDPLLRNRYQFWYFLYPTGNPLPYSAAALRRAIEDVRQTFDPNREDEALDRMVLVGHSMGGLLAKMLAQDSSDQLWSRVSSKGVDSLAIPNDEKEEVRRVFFFEPEPAVRRIVFIATPHQGSSYSKTWIAAVGINLISLPQRLRDHHRRLVAGDPDAFAPFFRGGLPTSIENLAPDSPFIQVLAQIPVAPQTAYHSIIAYTEEGDAAASTDGIVPYSSSHLEGARSECLVQSKHTYCPSHPLAILEVRRILLEHLQARPVDRLNGRDK